MAHTYTMREATRVGLVARLERAMRAIDCRCVIGHGSKALDREYQKCESAWLVLFHNSDSPATIKRAARVAYRYIPLPWWTDRGYRML